MVLAIVFFIVSVSVFTVNNNAYNVPILPRSSKSTSQQEQLTIKLIDGGIIPIHRVPLRFHDPLSPYTFAVTTTPTLSSIDEENGEIVDCDNDTNRTPTILNSTTSLPSYNFLATQVWPSSRTAAIVLEKYVLQQQRQQEFNVTTICEFGCGPGLPSITAALTASRNDNNNSSNKNLNFTVIATDIDSLALQLVQQAAIEQNISHILQTQLLDLTTCCDTSKTMNSNNTKSSNIVPIADLYILSDVFENGNVSVGAAHVTNYILQTYPNSYIWVFAQSDRAQREVYIHQLQQLWNTSSSELFWCYNSIIESPKNTLPKPTNNNDDTINAANVTMKTNTTTNPYVNRLWLCNIDETNVFYG